MPANMVVVGARAEEGLSSFCARRCATRGSARGVKVEVDIELFGGSNLPSQQGSGRRCDSGAYAIEAGRTRMHRHAAALGRNAISYVRALAPLTSRSKAAGRRHRDTPVAL